MKARERISRQDLRPRDTCAYDGGMTSYIGTCIRCDATIKITGTVGRFIPCEHCSTNPELIAERDAYMAEHPNGHYPMGGYAMKKVRGKLGKRECDEACRSARTEGCTCKCAGRHHGEAWTA